MHLRNRVEFLFAVSSVAISSGLGYFFGTRGVLLSAAIAIVAVAFSAINQFIRAFFNKYILLTTVSALLGTAWAYYYLNLNLSAWQFARSTLWTLLSLPLFLAILKIQALNNTKVVDPLLNFFASLSLVLAVFVSVELASGLPISPASIRAEDANAYFNVRLYVIGIEILLPLVPIFVLQKRLLSVCSILLLAVITGGKIVLALFLTGILFGLLLLFKYRRLRPRHVILLLIVLFFALLAADYLFERLHVFLQTGDERRLDQIQDAWAAILQDPITFLFGQGLGTAYTEAYLKYVPYHSLDEVSFLIENAQYDLENGFIALWLRFGLIGSITYIIVLFRYKNIYSIYFATFLFLSWLGTSISGPPGALLLASFAFAIKVFPAITNAYYSKV